jgi:CO/xanthine dehydrogenase Mo-binding subunit
MIVSAAALLAKNANPSDAEIAAGLEGNLCRCCTYSRITRAVRDAAEALRREKKAVSARRTSPHGIAAPPEEGERLRRSDSRVRADQARTRTRSTRRPERSIGSISRRREFLKLLAAVFSCVRRGARGPQSRPGGGTGARPSGAAEGAGRLAPHRQGREDHGLHRQGGDGQNIRTSLAQLVAEELRVPVTAIDLVMGDT